MIFDQFQPDFFFFFFFKHIGKNISKQINLISDIGKCKTDPRNAGERRQDHFKNFRITIGLETSFREIDIDLGSWYGCSQGKIIVLSCEKNTIQQEYC